jgi:hypothetical protein
MPRPILASAHSPSEAARQGRHCDDKATPAPSQAIPANRHLQKVLQRYEAFKAAADATAEYTAPTTPAEPETEEAIPRFGNRPMVSRLIRRVVERQPEGEEFGAHAIAAEVNRRYGDKLDKPVKPSAASTVLRRLARSRRIHETRPGKAFHGALYVRGARPAKG